MNLQSEMTREEVAEQAAQDVREWIANGRRGSIQNRYAALTREAKWYDASIKRALGSDDDEGRTA